MEEQHEDEDVRFTYKKQEYSAMVDYKAEDDWNIQNVEIWSDDHTGWSRFHEDEILPKDLTDKMKEAIMERSDELYRDWGVEDATDWKDFYD